MFYHLGFFPGRLWGGGAGFLWLPEACEVVEYGWAVEQRLLLWGPHLLAVQSLLLMPSLLLAVSFRRTSFTCVDSASELAVSISRSARAV